MANALEALWTAFSGFAPRLVGAGLVVVALLVIHQITGRFHLHRLYAAVGATSPVAVAQALALTAVSFAAMALYDVMAAQPCGACCLEPGRPTTHDHDSTR